MTRAILLYPTRLDPGHFNFDTSVQVFRIITPKELKRYSAYIHIVEVDFCQDESARRIDQVHSLTVVTCFGQFQRNESRNLANHINNMRDISFCNRDECTRRKTCERFLTNGGDELFTFILIEDPVNCDYYFPKFVPEFAGCRITTCDRKETCDRFGDSNYYISNSEWTEKNISACPFYKRKTNG